MHSHSCKRANATVNPHHFYWSLSLITASCRFAAHCIVCDLVLTSLYPQAQSEYPTEPKFTVPRIAEWTFRQADKCLSTCETGYYGNMQTGQCTALTVCGVGKRTASLRWNWHLPFSYSVTFR